MKFFDCNCYVGRTGVMNPNITGLSEDLVKVMDKCDISDALVYHMEAKDASPSKGNDFLLTEIEKYGNLHPVWVVMPHHTGEFYEPSVLIEKMKEKNVKAVRMFPGTDFHNFSVKDYCCEELFSVLEDKKIPLFIDVDQIGWDSVYDILYYYGNLKMVLCNTGYRCDRYLYPLMGKYSSLYFETSRYFPHQGIEHMVKAVGHERILFGSGMFEYSAGAGVYHIQKLMLDDNIKEDIAANNLIKLLEGVTL